MRTIEKLSIKCEGKTKVIWNTNVLGAVILEAKKKITAFNDPSKTQEFESKAILATNTTCRIFELLQKSGIPVAYRQQISDTEFLADDCEMIALEVIARRYAFGSYLNRKPEFRRDGIIPRRFHCLVIEFFLKTTEGELILKDGTKAITGLSTEEDDPFINDHNENIWELYHPKKPKSDKSSNLKRGICFDKILKDRSDVEKIEKITREVFLILESAFLQQNMHYIDFKIEFGYNIGGDLVVSDVIDSDSGRLRDFDWKDFSKQSFRDGESLDEVERKYTFVSDLVNRFCLPK